MSTAETKEKQPLPKAMVKPQVLTHVIDGFIIQEASEPFSVGKHSSDKENHPISANEQGETPPPLSESLCLYRLLCTVAQLCQC